MLTRVAGVRTQRAPSRARKRHGTVFEEWLPLELILPCAGLQALPPRDQTGAVVAHGDAESGGRYHERRGRGEPVLLGCGDLAVLVFVGLQALLEVVTVLGQRSCERVRPCHRQA